MREVQSRSAYDTDFEIPPGAPQHRVVAQTTFRQAVTLRSLFPQMRLRATAWYGNSKDNPCNPNPSVGAHFGEQTFEDVMIGYFDWLPDAPR